MSTVSNSVEQFQHVNSVNSYSAVLPPSPMVFFKLNIDIFTKTLSSTQIRSLPLQVGLHQGEHERDRLVGHRPLLHLPQVRGYSLRAKMTNSLLPSLSNMKSSGEYEDEMRRIAQVFVTIICK